MPNKPASSQDETKIFPNANRARAFSSARTLLDWALSPGVQKWVVPILLVVFSGLYFTETCFRAAQKAFWFDELCTLYLIRLRSFHATWAAVIHGYDFAGVIYGYDFNPPLFYLIERANRALLGDGQIAMRLPQILGFWTLCVCLFFFTRKRAGVLGGWVAMLLPRLTQAYYYAYDARPHGIVLGFSGLALICWQKGGEHVKRNWWLSGLSLLLCAAFLTHCYAVLLVIPFALAELVHTLEFRSIHRGVWLALLLPFPVAFVSYIPLLRSFQSHSNLTALFPPSSSQLVNFYTNLLAPGIPLIVLALVLFSFERAGFRFWSRSSWIGIDSTHISPAEVIAIFGFVALPVFGVVLARLVKGPFFARYFLCTIVGFCIALGIGVGSRLRNRNSLLIAILLTALVFAHTAAMAWYHYRGMEVSLFEPSTNVPVSMKPGDPLAIHPLLESANKPLPIAVINILDGLYLRYYAPAQNSRFFHFSGLKKNQISDKFDKFLRAHPNFYLYGMGIGNQLLLADLIDKGAKLESLKFDAYDRFIAELKIPEGQLRDHPEAPK